MVRDGVHADPLSGRREGDREGVDFERLERAVAFLLEEHERLSAEKQELLGELADREQRLSEMTSRLESERKRRIAAIESVDKILGRLEQLQSSVGAVMESA